MNRMVRNAALPMLAAVAVVSTAWQQGSTPVAQQVSVTGTVIDLACYFSKGQTGPSHLECAVMCAKAGVPFGILTAEKKLYLPAKHGESSNAALMEFLEQQVAVTGTAFSAAGTNTIEIASIAKKS